MYQGRLAQGHSLFLFLQCVNAAGTATLPDRAPQVKVWNPSGTLVLADLMPILDRYSRTGLFYYHLLLGGSYSTTGNWQVTYSYRASSFYGAGSDNFEIIPGGSDDGHVTAMHYYQRPQAQYVIKALESGNVTRGRNPRV